MPGSRISKSFLANDVYYLGINYYLIFSKLPVIS